MRSAAVRNTKAIISGMLGFRARRERPATLRRPDARPKQVPAATPPQISPPPALIGTYQFALRRARADGVRFSRRRRSRWSAGWGASVPVEAHYGRIVLSWPPVALRTAWMRCCTASRGCSSPPCSARLDVHAGGVALQHAVGDENQPVAWRILPLPGGVWRSRGWNDRRVRRLRRARGQRGDRRAGLPRDLILAPDRYPASPGISRCARRSADGERPTQGTSAQGCADRGHQTPCDEEDAS